MLKAGLALFRVTGKRTFLEWAEHAAWYLASWQWHHTVGYDAGTALGDIGYDTFGGTAVSTQHHHLDPFALAFFEDWLELAVLTGNTMWRDRALAAWANATIGISDGSLMVIGKLRPEGSQSEGFFHPLGESVRHSGMAGGVADSFPARSIAPSGHEGSRRNRTKTNIQRRRRE